MLLGKLSGKLARIPVKQIQLNSSYFTTTLVIEFNINLPKSYVRVQSLMLSNSKFLSMFLKI